MKKVKEKIIKILKSIHKYGWMISSVLALIAISVSGYTLFVLQKKILTVPTGQQTNPTTVDFDKFIKELSGNEPFLGQPNAPVIMVEFADFQCPFCKKFFDQTFQQIKQKYIDTGKVKLIFVDFAFLGQESVDAAEAAKCANDQGKFWEYHDALYTNQSGENLGAFSLTKLKGFARELGLNQVQFDECLTSDKYEKEVQDEFALAKKYGVNSTPTVFIENQVIKGAKPFDVFEQVIESVLKK